MSERLHAQQKPDTGKSYRSIRQKTVQDAPCEVSVMLKKVIELLKSI